MGFDISGFDDVLAELDRIGRFEEIAPKMLEESESILEAEVVKQAKKHWNTGDMAQSIKSTGALVGKGGGYYLCVRPTGESSEKKWQYAGSKSGKKGRRKVKVRNMEKAVWLEFGAKGRPAVPIITTAVLNAEPAVLKKLQEVFDREVGSE